MERQQPSHNTLINLALVGGLGIVIIMVALFIGAIEATSMNTVAFQGTLFLGFALVIIACVAWFGLVQPHKNFDDINVAQYHGHHHEEVPAEEYQSADIHGDVLPEGINLSTHVDDLTKIEGIGPKMSEALIMAGIDTFAKLAVSSEDEIKMAIETAGMRFAPSLSSWAKQAEYAAQADWDGLAAYQSSLTGGRE